MRDRSFVFLCFFVMTMASTTRAASETRGGSATVRTQQPSSLPNCVDSNAKVDEIKNSIKANTSNAFKYRGYQQALQSDSPTQLIARLAYAETMAARCPEANAQTVSLIAAVIKNRVRLRNGDERSVVFQLNQFASSLNIYDESMYADFLCPKDPNLWAQAMTAASTSEDRTNPVNQATNYFLYKHSPRFKKEPWNLPEVLPAPSQGGANLHSCIRFFKDANWH